MEASLILFLLGIVNDISAADVSIVVVMLAIELSNVDVWCDAMVSVVANDVVHDHGSVVPACQLAVCNSQLVHVRSLLRTP